MGQRRHIVPIPGRHLSALMTQVLAQAHLFVARHFPSVPSLLKRAGFDHGPGGTRHDGVFLIVEGLDSLDHNVRGDNVRPSHM